MPHRLTLIQWFAAYGVAFAVMAVLDGVWLGWLMRDFYKTELGPLMAESVRLAPAAAYYLLYPAAIVYLAVAPSASLGEALLRSAVLGLTAFGVYDLTNLSTLRDFSVRMTLVDMTWGTIATALGGAAAYHFVVGRA